MTPHINANLGDYADTVLMPGDPLRAKYLAEKFLDNLSQVNSIRNCFGYTGLYKGKRVSFQASGMGQPSLSIYATELFTKYNVGTIIRVGTCGSLQENIDCGDIIIPVFSYTEGKTIQSAQGDAELIKKITEILKLENLKYHSGKFISNDNYYQDNMEWWKPLASEGVLGVDMETYSLYNIASKFNKKALTVNFVSDNLISYKDIGTEARVLNSDKITKAILEII